MKTATVKWFLDVLSGALTQYDEKLQAKQPNIYRLGHYFGALEHTRAACSSVESRSDRDAMDVLKQALHQFYEPNQLPPVRRLIGQIDAWVSSGKVPKYGK
jgi:hypothetical protein